MKLPHADRAIVDHAKVREYLLSLDHPVGRAKARFFLGLGFTRANWSLLQRSLLDLARDGEAVAEQRSPFGRKYRVEGMLQGPTRAATVHTIWLIRPLDDRPHFVTAFPR